jgi:hypothetical protein
MLDELAERAILVDIARQEGVTIYALPPPMAGFFEFSLMRAARRCRPEAAERTLLPVHQRRGGVHPRALS